MGSYMLTLKTYRPILLPGYAKSLRNFFFKLTILLQNIWEYFNFYVFLYSRNYVCCLSQGHMLVRLLIFVREFKLMLGIKMSFIIIAIKAS